MIPLVVKYKLPPEGDNYSTPEYHIIRATLHNHFGLDTYNNQVNDPKRDFRRTLIYNDIDNSYTNEFTLGSDLRYTDMLALHNKDLNIITFYIKYNDIVSPNPERDGTDYIGLVLANTPNQNNKAFQSVNLLFGKHEYDDQPIPSPEMLGRLD